ncbi:MAG: hypothetical protein IPF47_13770 [Gemmatimonadetes bacterium]|nr:hypothetical protein [Gemmatimonadota bacterium]
MRIEATNTDNTAKRVAIAGSTATVTDVSGSTNYANVFPSLNATWRVDEYTNIKAAVTTSLVRPQFRDMVPEHQARQPDLGTTALAFDLMRSAIPSGFAGLPIIFPTSRREEPRRDATSGAAGERAHGSCTVQLASRTDFSGPKSDAASGPARGDDPRRGRRGTPGTGVF